jgi:hypothetical protein
MIRVPLGVFFVVVLVFMVSSPLLDVIHALISERRE